VLPIMESTVQNANTSSCHNVFHASTAFGGFLQSGNGRELGKYALDLWTQVKQVKIAL
jgi:aldehyde dehydrogenase (NAD+)